ncbi:MAG: hypothetical protein IPM29_09855 [Planctomycetes bacterium]|nr:hypothetical protein [Planctomycetota bacterium]
MLHASTSAWLGGTALVIPGVSRPARGSTSGSAPLDSPLPEDPSYRGTHICGHGLVFDLSVSRLGVVGSNGVDIEPLIRPQPLEADPEPAPRAFLARDRWQRAVGVPSFAFSDTPSRPPAASASARPRHR